MANPDPGFPTMACLRVWLGAVHIAMAGPCLASKNNSFVIVGHSLPHIACIASSSLISAGQPV